jgi:hypothetical protein
MMAGARGGDSNPRPFDYESDVRRRSGLLKTDLACSGWMPCRSRRLQTDPDGSRRIVWMIIGMIKAHPTENRMPRGAGEPVAISRLVQEPQRGTNGRRGPDDHPVHGRASGHLVRAGVLAALLGRLGSCHAHPVSVDQAGCRPLGGTCNATMSTGRTAPRPTGRSATSSASHPCGADTMEAAGRPRPGPATGSLASVTPSSWPR